MLTDMRAAAPVERMAETVMISLAFTIMERSPERSREKPEVAPITWARIRSPPDVVKASVPQGLATATMEELVLTSAKVRVVVPDAFSIWVLRKMRNSATAAPLLPKLTESILMRSIFSWEPKIELIRRTRRTSSVVPMVIILLVLKRGSPVEVPPWENTAMEEV